MGIEQDLKDAIREWAWAGHYCGLRGELADKLRLDAANDDFASTVTKLIEETLKTFLRIRITETLSIPDSASLGSSTTSSLTGTNISVSPTR